MRLTELDRHRLRYLAIALSGFVLFPIGWRLETLIGGRAVVIVFLIAAVAWLTAGYVFWHRWFFFRCPACDALFYHVYPARFNHLARNPLSNQCPECGDVLPKT